MFVHGVLLPSSLVRAGTSARLLNTQRSRGHCTDGQGLPWGFPAQLIPCVWQRAPGHVQACWCIQNLSHSAQASSGQRLILDAGDSFSLALRVAYMHIFFFPWGNLVEIQNP